MEKQVITTSDGSHSIFLPSMNEHYHSKHGAVAESKHIFIKEGLIEVSKNTKKIKIFEVGMGTGLNVLTTWQAAKENHLEIEMHTVEAFPLNWEEIKELNFAFQLGIDYSEYEKIHQSKWNESEMLSEQFKLYKYDQRLQSLDLQDDSFDLIYFDAFAPEKQEEMWTEEVFEKLFRALKVGGVIVTYCVKGDIRRRLQKIGYTVEKVPGPIGGKREMMRGVKC